jgi:hypothetical protein
MCMCMCMCMCVCIYMTVTPSSPNQKKHKYVRNSMSIMEEAEKKCLKKMVQRADGWMNVWVWMDVCW